MTSIYDIPYEDIKEFLRQNKRSFKNKDDAYDQSLILLKNRKAVGHTTSIIEWLIAHNLLVNKVNIPNCRIYEIDNMSQSEINKLAKKLTMNGNNIDNIKNILRHLHKLNEEELVEDVKKDILQTLIKLEEKEINVDGLAPKDVIDLLMTHWNKALIRKIIYDNMEKIIFYNFLSIDTDKFDDLWYFRDLSYDLPKSIVLKLLELNKEMLSKEYSIEDRDQLLEDLEESPFGVMNTNIHIGIEDLFNFLLDLIKIKEISLAKRIFDIANEYNFRGQIAHNEYSFNEYVVTNLSYQKDINIINTLLDFMGEAKFMDNFNLIISFHRDPAYKSLFTKSILRILIESERYDLLLKVLNLLISKDFNGSAILKLMLPRINKAIELNNNNLLIEYLDILNKAVDNRIRLGGNRTQIVENMIRKIEEES